MNHIAASPPAVITFLGHPFLLPEMVAGLSGMLNYFLKYLEYSRQRLLASNFTIMCVVGSQTKVVERPGRAYEAPEYSRYSAQMHTRG